MTNSVNARGLGIEFVARCVAVSQEHSTLAGALEWTNRQTGISRFYKPGFW